MKTRQRLVVDSNALLSHLLLPASVPGQAVRLAIEHGQLLASEDTMLELADVLARPKFDRYISLADRRQFLLHLGRIAEMVSIVRSIRACRDPRDDKFLELAVNGSAHAIVTGDSDLLCLHPFQGIRIVTPADWLAGWSGGSGDL